MRAALSLNVRATAVNAVGSGGGPVGLPRFFDKKGKQKMTSTTFVLSTGKISAGGEESIIGHFDTLKAAKATADLGADGIDETVAPWVNPDDQTWQLGGEGDSDTFWMIRETEVHYMMLMMAVEQKIGKEMDDWEPGDEAAIDKAAREVATEFGCVFEPDEENDGQSPLAWTKDGVPVPFKPLSELQNRN